MTWRNGASCTICMATLSGMWCRWQSFHLPKPIFNLLPSSVISNVFELAPVTAIIGTPKWYQFSLITPTSPEPDVGASYCDSIHEPHAFFTLKAQRTILGCLPLQGLQTEGLTCSGPLAFDETKDSLLGSLLEIPNYNIASSVGLACRGLLRVHHEVSAGGKDITVKDKFHERRRFVLSGVCYTSVNVRDMSSVIQGFLDRIFNESMRLESRRRHGEQNC